MMPLLQQQVNTTSLKGSFGVMRKEADVQPTPEQMLQVCVCVRERMCVCAATLCSPPASLKVYELTLHYTQHWDHNVVTAALELLQQTFRTPPPELLHLLITAGSIPHATVFRQDNESRARSGSILELIGNALFFSTKVFLSLIHATKHLASRPVSLRCVHFCPEGTRLLLFLTLGLFVRLTPLLCSNRHLFSAFQAFPASLPVISFFSSSGFPAVCSRRWVFLQSTPPQETER